MNDHFLLKSDNAKQIYFDYAKDLPIIDYHNHLSVDEIASDRRYGDLTELWLTPDPYKHRLMRICGVEEHFITGDADPAEKFKKFCAVFPYFAGNPVYDWARMELSRVFGIEEIPCKDNAKYIYDRANEMLASSEFSCNSILSRFNIAYQAPVALITEELTHFNGKTIVPSLRGDSLLFPTENMVAELKDLTDSEIYNRASYQAAISHRLDQFHAAGCRFADHALDATFFNAGKRQDAIDLLVWLGGEYAKRGWTLLLHLGAKRNTSTRLATLAGPAGGYAAVGTGFDVTAVCDLLGEMERRGGLPDTVLFPLNMSDQAALAVMQGSFSEDTVASKVQLGPAWWWCDHIFGIRNTLSCISSFGLLSQFIGMTTDSRSILSFVRHDYFRRILCSYLDEIDREQELGMSPSLQGEFVKKICYQNAMDKLHRNV